MIMMMINNIIIITIKIMINKKNINENNNNSNNNIIILTWRILLKCNVWFKKISLHLHKYVIIKKLSMIIFYCYDTWWVDFVLETSSLCNLVPQFSWFSSHVFIQQSTGYNIFHFNTDTWFVYRKKKIIQAQLKKISASLTNFIGKLYICKI